MIKGKLFPDRLGVLLLFGDDINRFEKELIIGFRDNEIKQVVEYNSLQTEITVNLYPDGSEDDNNEEPVNTTYLKNELIEIAIEAETNRALHHLEINYFEVNDYSWHQWIFARILKCYISAQQVSEGDYPYRDLFIECFEDIVRKSILLYEGIFGPHFNNLAKVHAKLESAPKKNNTGFCIKPNLYKNIIQFTNGLITAEFIDEKDAKNFKEFLKGKIPSKRIDWKRGLRYLVYLINQLVSEDDNSNPKYLSSPPKQQWKSLYSIFSFNQSNLPAKFNGKSNKLGEKSKQTINSLLLLLNKL